MDVVAVYKIDRLSRSLIDFVKVMETFDRCGVRFVSITQAFDTSTSMGRLMLNILMSFAEFERQVISERTRDKMAATRRKGLWTGGHTVLGYDVRDKRLVVNPTEAERVREIFKLYLDLGALVPTLEVLRSRGWTNKSGGQFTKNTLRRLLTCPLYIGKVGLRGEVHDGVHEAILDLETWEAVQHQLRQRPRSGYREGKNRWGALLSGIARCGSCGAAMSHHFTRKKNRCYSYYVCQTAQKQGAAQCPGSRISTTELEQFVIERIREIGKDPSLVAETLKAAKEELQARKPELVGEIRRLEQETKKLSTERKNLLDAVAQGGPGVPALMGRLGEVDDSLGKSVNHAEEVRAELVALESRVIDEDDLRAALGAFDPVWEQLFPREKARILRLLLQKVEYHAQDGKVEIVFRPGGIRALAKGEGRETA